MRIISDIHGNIISYRKAVRNCKQSIQLGDLNFTYNFLHDIDYTNHRFIGGNHDNYDIIRLSNHYLGDYGYVTDMEIPFFFVRGAWSIDRAWRIQHEQRVGERIWWDQEELGSRELNYAIKLYEEIKPDLVLTHTSPQSIIDEVGDLETLKSFGFERSPYSITSLALDSMLDIYQPKLWIFGHFHKFKDFTVDKTRFICLNACGSNPWYCDIDKELNVCIK